MEFISVDISFSFFNIFRFKEFVPTLFERRISIVRSLETIRRFPDVLVDLPIREESSLERSSVFWDSAGDVASRSRNFPWIERCHGGFRGFWKNFSNVRAVWKLGILSIIGSVPILCKLSLPLCLRSSFVINATTPGTGCGV